MTMRHKFACSTLIDQHVTHTGHELFSLNKSNSMSIAQNVAHDEHAIVAIGPEQKQQP